MYVGFPWAFHSIGFALSWPRGHGDRDCREGLGTQAPKLKVSAKRDRKADAGFDWHDFLLFTLAAPHLSAT